MKTYQFKTTTEVAPEALWKVLADLENWPQWDTELESTQWLNRERRTFRLKPKGAGAVTITVAVHEEGSVWTDRAHFPLAVLDNEHRLAKLPSGGTELSTTITLRGPLAGLWDKVVVKAMADGQAAPTLAMIEYARTRSK